MSREHVGMLLGRVLLRLDEAESSVLDNLSAITRVGEHLFVAADERACVERLAPLDRHIYGEHTRIPLADHLPLADGEVDIEAMEADGPWLWVTGSHSTKRARPERGSRKERLRDLERIRDEPARFVLARVPLKGADVAPARARKKPARLPGRSSDNLPAADDLVTLLEKDPHLAPFLAARLPDGESLRPLPGKDNGFDIEGLAVRGDRVILGLRGPVLRGWAMLVELNVKERGPGELGLAPVAGDRTWRKHFVDLDGLGVRELCFDGDDLLVLAGPTMDLDGPVRLFRLRDAEAMFEKHKGDSITELDGSALRREFDVPFGAGVDHAEGLSLFSYFDEDDSVLVLHDAPAPDRYYGKRGLLADVYRLR